MCMIFSQQITYGNKYFYFSTIYYYFFVFHLSLGISTGSYMESGIGDGEEIGWRRYRAGSQSSPCTSDILTHHPSSAYYPPPPSNSLSNLLRRPCHHHPYPLPRTFTSHDLQFHHLRLDLYLHLHHHALTPWSLFHFALVGVLPSHYCQCHHHCSFFCWHRLCRSCHCQTFSVHCVYYYFKKWVGYRCRWGCLLPLYNLCRE